MCLDFIQNNSLFVCSNVIQSSLFNALIVKIVTYVNQILLKMETEAQRCALSFIRLLYNRLYTREFEQVWYPNVLLHVFMSALRCNAPFKRKITLILFKKKLLSENLKNIFTGKFIYINIYTLMLIPFKILVINIFGR